ncbi:hypothetical protein PLEOSDRAFT_1106016 [Pleurotus ostreatus PC15]|uniref:Uncharacterized protein n=1 Tax=Pleurotus ostreatus (strain PC15) TaxID=1137138 RepID=A0A067NSQ1_PLEO1|nr:hypothetical protein PLEOSDRAFT_1106016 [Pleurotus ostreatus PC15]
MTTTQPLTAPDDVHCYSHTLTPISDHRMPTNYPDVSSIGEGSNYHRQQRPLAQVHSDARRRQVHDIVGHSESTKNPLSVRQHMKKIVTTIAATQPTPPPNSPGPSFYNGWKGSTQLGSRYTETRPPYTVDNDDAGYGQGTSEGSFDTGYSAGRHIDNRRGYQGRQRSSLSPPRYAGPAFAYGPYHGGHIANGDHRYRHRSSVSPAAPPLASTSAHGHISQYPEDQNVEAAAYQQYRPYPMPDAAMCGGTYAPPQAGYLASAHMSSGCRYTNDYSMTQLGATSWMKTLEKANLQPRLTFPDRGQYVAQTQASEYLYPLAFSGQRYTRRRIWVTFDVAADSPNLKKVKRLIRGLTAYPYEVDEATEATQMPPRARVESSSVARAQISRDRNHGDTVATAGTASTSKAKGAASSSEKSRKRKSQANDNDTGEKANRSRGNVGTKATASTSKANKNASETTISEKKAGKRRAVEEDTWAGSELPRPLSPLDKARRRYRKPAQSGASSSATTYSHTTAMRMDREMALATDGAAGGVEGNQPN